MKHSNHSKRKGKTAAVIGIVLAILLVQRCCFHFLVYPHTYDKYAQGEDLNFYEVANVYMEYIDIELLGLIVSPQTSKLMFVKQFHLPLKYRDVPAKWDNNENVRKTILSLLPGQTKKSFGRIILPSLICSRL